MLELIAVLEQVCTEHRAEHEQEVILRVKYFMHCVLLRNWVKVVGTFYFYVQFYIRFLHCYTSYHRSEIRKSFISQICTYVRTYPPLSGKSAHL